MLERPNHSSNDIPPLEDLYRIGDEQLSGREVPEHLAALLPLSMPKVPGVRGPTNMVAEEHQAAVIEKCRKLQELSINLKGENPFFVLGLTTKTSDADITSRYRAGVLIVHPDKCPGFENDPVFDGFSPCEAFHILNNARVQIAELKSAGYHQVEIEGEDSPKKEGKVKKWVRKLVGTGLVRTDSKVPTEEDWSSLAFITNILNGMIDTALEHAQVRMNLRGRDQNYAAESAIVHEILKNQLPKISPGARKAAMETYIGTTATEETQKKRATAMLAYCLDQGWTIEMAQTYAAIRLYMGRTCDRGSRWFDFA